MKIASEVLAALSERIWRAGLRQPPDDDPVIEARWESSWLEVKAECDALMAEAIREALEECRGNIRATARRLGVSHPTLWKKIQTLGIDAASYRR